MKYTCYCCNYETHYKSSINKHKLTTKHIKNYKRNKYCDICQKEFLTVGNFKIHWNREHFDESDSDDIIIDDKLDDKLDENIDKQPSENLIKKEKLQNNNKGIVYLIQPAELIGLNRYKIGCSINSDL